MQTNMAHLEWLLVDNAFLEIQVNKYTKSRLFVFYPECSVLHFDKGLANKGCSDYSKLQDKFILL